MGFFDNFTTDEHDETAIERNDAKSNFYLELKKNGFDMEDIDEDTRLPKCLIPVIKNELNAFNKFNLLLGKLHKQRRINLVDGVVFLTTDFLKPEVLLKCLDEMNFILIKNELTKRYNIGGFDKKKTILDFL